MPAPFATNSVLRKAEDEFGRILASAGLRLTPETTIKCGQVVRLVPDQKSGGIELTVGEAPAARLVFFCRGIDHKNGSRKPRVPR